MSIADPAPAEPAHEPDDLAAKIEALLDEAGVHGNRSLVRRIVTSGLGLGVDGTDRLDLKISAAALEEMRNAFRLFAPFDGVPKVTVFGSARTQPRDPLYRRAEAVAASLAGDGWMVVTGAGPGIMQAAAHGAGPERAIGISIRLPFEERPSEVFDVDPNLVSMKYFFTRKLMLMKESRGFVCLPGGFGTLDETFELLTLQQTGKAEPVPIVLLDAPGGGYWQGLRRYVEEQLVPLGMIAPDDLDRVLITDTVDAAVAEITGFWRNYDSLRWVGDRLVLRLNAEPTAAEVDELNERFGSLCTTGRIEPTGPLGPERTDGDELDHPRLVLTLDPHKVGELHRLIRAINALDSAPDQATPPTVVGE
ncbi:TIGR00730 family Rossman fold protein [Agromyces endophyticus]|uniref:LOG family protein n=1 Tax=Agromyces sp. H17E-10 TaxID=2932244 RepID=UPI001FCF91F5|nr:TIGR00730 family Rossman fold protein [Agromyces sp. H17E-10]UOQ89658.1 TIGR00730 family Rossman fold protein [Agromyces sp. H17E-10]